MLVKDTIFFFFISGLKKFKEENISHYILKNKQIWVGSTTHREERIDRRINLEYNNPN